MHKKTSQNTNKLVSDLSKMKALQRQNKCIENRHLIRQSMKYHHPTIRDWTRPKNKNMPDIHSYKPFLQKLGTKLDEYTVKTALIKWLVDVYKPTALLTVQLPDQLKTERKDKALDYLRSAMAYFERQLLGRDWKDYHLPFVCFTEKGTSGLWHFHIIFNQGQFEAWHLWLALNNTINKFKWPDYSMHLDIMHADKSKVVSYCLKEVKVNYHGHFESNCFIFSDELFNFPIGS